MQARIIPIGNSKGIRIPRALLELCRIQTAVEVNVKGETIVIRPIKHRPRAGWDAAFITMHETGEDRPMIPDKIDLDLGQWEW